MRIANKVWVVTGAGSGMGQALTLLMLQKGARVAAVDVNAAGLAETAAAADAERRLSTHVVDLADPAAIAVLPEAVLAQHEHVDGVVNNAGIIQPFVPVVDLTDAAIAKVLDVNLMGTVHMVKAFLPLLLERPEAHLANVSSMGGFFPFPGQTVYGASKAAVKLLTEGLYAELLDTPVSVSVIMPGAVNTAISTNSGVAMAGDAEQSGMPMTSAAKAAQIMVEGLEHDRLHIYVGTDARLMSLAIKVAPRLAIRFVKEQMAKRLGDPKAPSHI